MEVTPNVGAARPRALSGAEPPMRWRTLCDVVAAIAQEFGRQMVVTLRAMAAGLPRSRSFAGNGSAAFVEWSTTQA